MALLSDPAGATTGGGDSYLGEAVRRIPAARLGVVVVHDLVAALVTEEVKPGELLPPESELCAHFGVSRTVIRESIKRLEEKGMVRVVQGRGTEVTPTADWNILDKVVLSTLIEHDAELGILDELAVVRSQLESVMASSAAEHRSSDELETLRSQLERMRETVTQPEIFASADIDFHFCVMDLSHTRLTRGISRTLTTRARDNARFDGAPGPDAYTLTLAEHERIFAAIEAGDSAEAARAMSDHITLAWERRRLPKNQQ